MALSDFVDKAPCNGADPWLFDQYHLDLAVAGLNYCKQCVFWENCNSLVKPKESFFDGVASGKVWRNGRILAKLDPAIPNHLIVGEEEFIDAQTLAI